MLALKPITEDKASGDVAEIYRSVKQTFGLANVPLIFQYLAVFPGYLSYVWQQAITNLNDAQFKKQAAELENFCQTAISYIYAPSGLTKIFLEKIENRAEKLELSKFVTTISQMNAALYFLSLAIRESLKGKYLGIKQIGKNLEEEEKSAFNDLSEGFLDLSEKEETKVKEGRDVRTYARKDLSYKAPTGITVSVFAQFFNSMEKEMDKLIRQEKYLLARVELERFAVSRLSLLPHPLDSSIASVFREAYNNPQFPELIYLVSDLFPTQTPFKLMASAVMKVSLDYSRIKANTRSTELSVA